MPLDGNALGAEINADINANIAGKSPTDTDYGLKVWQGAGNAIINYLTVTNQVPNAGSLQTTTVVAQENILEGDPVTSQGWKANSANPSRDRGRVIGIAQSIAGVGFPISCITSGMVTDASWTWTAGDKLFLNGQTVSKTAPSSGFTVQMAVAIAPTIIDVGLGPQILL